MIPIPLLKQKIKELKVLSVGHVTHDRYNDKIVPGGCAFYGAKTAAGLGAASYLLTKTGTDFICSEDLEGILVEQYIEGETTVFTNSYPENGLRIQLVESQAGSLTPNNLPEEFTRPDLFFLAPVMGEIDPHHNWHAPVKANFTSLSLQGFLKRGEDRKGQRLVVKKDEKLPLSLFEKVDAVFLSEEDIELFGEEGLLSTLIGKVKTVFVTLGDKGVDIYSCDIKNHTGIFETKCKDPTGAGDTFAMATSILLALGNKPTVAARFGACAASIIIEKDGPLNIDNIPETYDRFMDLVNP